MFRSDTREYALKQIEGTGISMSACREIAVSILKTIIESLIRFELILITVITRIKTRKCDKPSEGVPLTRRQKSVASL